MIISLGLVFSESLLLVCRGIFDQMVRAETDNRAWITAVEVAEDNANSATYKSNLAFNLL